MKILSISYSELYKNIPHAGGQTYTYYLSKISKNKNIELKCICMSESKEKSMSNFDDFGTTGIVLYRKGNIFFMIKRVLLDVFGYFFNKKFIESYFKYHEYTKALKRIKKDGFYPDIIILEWTQCVVLAHNCKKIFPLAKIVASEHDVRFLGVEREANNEKKFFLKNMLILKFKIEKRRELNALNICDLILTHNKKDLKLLIDNNISSTKIYDIVPYYNTIIHGNREMPFKNDVIFWGAMSRKENYEAVEWFIKNVMSKERRYRLIVIGNNPPEELKKYESSNVTITGFVEDPSNYFREAVCMVVPLLSGAGIKVKVIEAMAAGLPVLTNDIGIEGIPATDNVSYIHCRTSQDYLIAINKLIDNQKMAVKIGNESKKLISKEFNLEMSAMKYMRLLEEMLDK